MYANIRGLKPRTVPSKVPYIQDLLCHSNQLFAALTETWLHDHLDAEIGIEGYTPFRADRKRLSKKGVRDGGGALLYLREDLAVNTDPVMTFSNGAVEVLGLHIKTHNLMIFVLYRQPNDPKGKNLSTSKEFREALEAVSAVLEDHVSPTPDILLLGDFNLPHMDWNEGKIRAGAAADERRMINLLQNFTDENFLFQQINEPTHVEGNILDLCFSNNPGLLHSYGCVKTQYSDHHIIQGKTTLSPLEANSSERSTKHSPPSHVGGGFDDLNFFSDNADWNGLAHELGALDWSQILTEKEPNDMMNSFVQSCVESSKKFIPKKSAAKKKQNSIPRNRRILMRRRTKVVKQLSATKSQTRKIKLEEENKEIERKLQQSYRQEKTEMERRAVHAIEKNSKYFFSYAKKFSTVTTGIGPLIDAAGSVVSTACEMAGMLSTQYTSVFSKPKNPLQRPEDIFPDRDIPQGTPSLCDIEFTTTDIESAIDTLSANSAPGPDRFPAILLKICKKQLSTPLVHMWRASMDAGIIPGVLKTATIIPIFKGGNHGTPKNYRPIALTSHVIKIFEKVVRKHIVKFMDDHHLFNPSQHGFRHGRSCLSQLLAHYDRILDMLEQGHNVDVIYIDFAKAFDKVDFMVTLQKLNSMGINGHLGRWIHSFLTNRTQQVAVNGAKSAHTEVLSGVPQGSVLGPLLFLILIGDIDRDVAQAFLSSFADDTRIGSKINSQDHMDQLQKDLDSVYAWTEQNNMELNADKFELLRYGPNTDFHQFQYKSNSGSPIQEKDDVKDLGVIMSTDGSFKKQIKKTVAAAKSQCSWILRTFRTRERKPMLVLWKSLVQCKLDYCSQLWSPSEKGDIQAIEMVQRSFLRKISSLQPLQYWEQLREAKMYSQERRRDRYTIIYIWKILENMVPNIYDEQGAEKIASKWHARRGRECIIPSMNTGSKRRFLTLRYASLPIKGQRLFNVLPSDIRNITGCTVDTFKYHLDKYLRTVPDEPQIQGYTAQRRSDSNSLIDMTKFAVAHSMSRVEVPGVTSPDGGGCAYSVAGATL